MKLKSFYFKFFIFLNLLVFIVFSVFPPFVEVFKVLADEAPKLEIKSYLADILPGNDLPVTLEIKNISNIRLVSVGAEFNLGAGYSFDDSSIPEECEDCVRPEILGNNILFRNIADLLPNETKRISFEIKTPNTLEIGTQHNINFTAFGFAEDDLINKFIAETIGTFKILPFEVEVNMPTNGLVGEQVTNQVTIINNNIQDSSTLQIPVTTTPEITPSITPTPDDESGSEPAPTVTPTPTEFEYVVEPATLEINLDEGLEYVPGSQRVENYDPARVIFNAFNESVSSARTILQWVFQDGIKVENFTNPIKVFFDTIFRNIGHNQTADNRVNFTARYNDTPSTSIEYNKQININTTIGYFDLTKQCSPYKVSVGENVTCKIKVKTSVEYSVSNVKIEDQIPDGLEFVSYSPIGGLSILSSQPDKIEWLISSIPNGIIFEFEYVLKLNQFYSDLSIVLTADNFKSVTTLEANWQNISDSTVGNNTDSTETKITTDRIDYTFGIRKKGSSVDYTKSVLSSIGDVFETRNVLDFPNTPTKNFELKIFAPVGTKISNFSLNPSMCVDGCTEIILPTNNISPNSQIEFSFDIEVLNDTRLNYTSIIRNLYRGSYYNSFDQKKDLVDELTIEIIEPKIEIQKTKISGIVAKGEIFSTKTTFKNSGKDVAYVLNVQDFVDPSKVTLNSTTPITVVSSLGNTFSFSFDGDKLISENLILLPSESIELTYELRVKDYVLYGDDIFLNSYVSDYSNRESSYDGIKRNYSEFTHEYKLKAKEPLVSTNITVSPFSISEIGGKFLIARNETFDLNLFVREVGGGKVYNGNLEFYVNGDKFIYTDFDSARSWFRSRGLDLLGIDNHQVFTESFELNPYYIKSAKFTLKPLRSLSIGDEINLEILFEGQDAISQQIRKDGSDRTIQDVDNDDKTNKAISIVRKDFTPPVGLVKFFVDGIETGFTNSDFVDVSLEVIDPNLKHTIEVLSSSLLSEIKRVSINEDSVLKIELVNGSVFEYTIGTIPFENEYLKIIDLSESSLKLLLKNLPSDREHVFKLIDWEDNSINVSKQIILDKVPPILAWIELSPSDVYRNIEYTATKNIFAHLGLVDDNPGGFYRISLDGVNYSDWASLSIGNNVVPVDLSSQGSVLKLYAQFKDLAGNLYPLVLFDTINYTNYSLNFDFSFVNNRVNTSFPDISFNIHNPADSSNITEKVYLSKGDSSTSLGGFVFYEYLPNKTNIDTTSTGTKTLCFKAKAITLQESNVVCKNVIFDNVAPSGSINYTSGQINFNAIDPVLSDGTVGSSVLARVRFNGGSWSDWVSSSSPFYTGNVSWNFGINYIHYQFKDTANNISSIQEYIYDYHPDSNPRITINDNEPFTDLEKVRVKLDPQRNALGQLPSLFRIKQKYYPIDPRNPTLSQVETNFTHWVEFSTQFEWRLTNAFFETMSNGVKPEYSFGQYTLGVEYMYPDTTLSGSVDWDSIYYAPVYGAHIVLDRALHLTSITGQTHNYNITITNFGSLPWQKAIEGVVNPVRLVYRWKHKLPDYQYPWGTIRDFLPLHYRGGEFDLPSNVYYGQVISIPVSIVSPEIYGLYDIEIDLVHEGKGYFADFGSSSVKGNVDVHQDPDRPPLSKGINPETGQPFDFDLPEGIGGYYAGQIIYIRGIWERAPAGVWWHYQVWDSGILYKFVNIWQGDSYLGHRVEVVVRATGVGWNFEVLSIRKIIPTFSAQVHHRGQPSRIVVNRGTTDTLYYLFLNTGSSDAVWRRHSTALRVLSSTPGINLNFQTLIQQEAVNPGSVASVIYPFSISSNAQFGDHLVCFSFLTTYDNVDRQMLQECITFEVQPTLAEQREIICSVPQKVYSQPSTNASVLGTLNKDDKFIHTRTFGSFLEIYYGSSSTQKGYLENTWNCFSAAVSVPNPIKITELPPRPVRPTGNQGYIIRLSGVGILHGPSKLFPEVCSIPFDAKVTIIGEVDFDSYSVGWLKVRGENGCEGWVSKGHVDYTGPQTKLQVNLAPEYSTAYSCNGGHNVHIGPAYEFRVVGFLNRNQDVFIREEWNGWVNIGNGWIPKFVMCRGRYTPSSTFTGAVGGASVFMDTYYERPIKDSYRIPFLGGFSAVRLNKYLQVVPHGGVDYTAPCGTKVYASSSGKVVSVRKGSTIGGNNPIYTDYANFVTIDHSNNTRTRYFHLGDVYVNLGDYVQTGQLIGTIGLTGYTTGCHLHFELWADKNNPNSKVDPEEIFNLSLSGLAPNLSILQRQSRLSSYSIVSGDLGKIHPVCGTYVRDYNFVMNSLGDINTQYANIMYNPNNGQSYVLRGDIRLAYWNKNGCDLLKYPTSEELTAAVSPQGTSGRYQNFDRGQIYLSSKGTYLVFGKIWDLYNLIGGTRSKYGFPTSDVFIQNSVKCQRFEGGVLCENFAKEFFAIYSVSGNRVPISGIHDFCGGKRQDYTDGSHIIYNPNTQKAYLLKGGIAWSYWTNGGCKSFGLPTGNSGRIDNNHGKGWYQHFEKANIYWHETNRKVQPGIVRGNIRNYFESKGGVSNGNEMGWPEGSEWGSTSYTCNSNGISGTMQHFTNGKVYLSSIATVYIPWSDWNWINHYENVEGGVSSMGWPKSVKATTYDAWQTEYMYFEKDNLQGVRIGPFWSIKRNPTGCGDTTRRNEDQRSGAPQCVIDSVWQKETTAFMTYKRQSGDNGVLHKLNNNLWIVDYQSITIKDASKSYGWSAIIANANTCQSYYTTHNAWEWYRDGSKWNIYGAPTSDYYNDQKTNYHEGGVDWQTFEKATFTYANNLKLEYGILGAGIWRNYASIATVTEQNVNQLYNQPMVIDGNTIQGTGVNSLLGAPVSSEFKYTDNISMPEGNTINTFAQQFQGGYIILNPATGKYEIILSSYGYQKAIDIIAGTTNIYEYAGAFFNGFADGFGGVLGDISGIGFELVLKVAAALASYFGFPIIGILYLGSLVVAIGRVFFEIQRNWNEIQAYTLSDPTAGVKFLGSVIGSIVGGIATGIAINSLANTISKSITRLFANRIFGRIKSLNLETEFEKTLTKLISAEKTTEVGNRILQKLEVNPSLASKIVGSADDISKLSPEDTLKALEGIQRTGKVFDIAEYFRLRQLGQLSDDVDSWFSWGRVTGTPGQKFTSPINGKEYLIKNPSDLGPEELAQLRQVLSEGKSGKVIAEQSVKNFDFHTDDGIAIEFKSQSTNNWVSVVNTINEAKEKFKAQNIPPKNSLIDIDFTYEGMKAGQYVKPSSIGISEIQKIIDEIRIYNPPYYPVRFKYLENGVIKFYEYIP